MKSNFLFSGSPSRALPGSQTMEKDMTIHRRMEAVLGGGGVKGFCHIGFLEGCRLMQVSFTSVLGVSVGSLVAALHCNGFKPDEIQLIFGERLRTKMIKAARNYSGDTPYSKLALALLGYRPQPLKDAFTSLGEPRKPNVDFGLSKDSVREAVRDQASWYPDLLEPMREMVKELGLEPHPELKILAFDAIERKPVLFAGTNYDLALALAASCSLPGAFRPVDSADGRGLYVDGALYHRNPVEFCRGPALVSKLGFASALPAERLSPVEYYGHLREMLGLNQFQASAVDNTAGHHIVVEMETPRIAGMSFGISRQSQDQMVAYGKVATMTRLEAAFKQAA